MTPSHTVDLVNTLIDGTNVHKALIQFKKNYSYGKDGTVGIGYWNGFKKRHGYEICTKKRQKYDLD